MSICNGKKCNSMSSIIYTSNDCKFTWCQLLSVISYINPFHTSICISRLSPWLCLGVRRILPSTFAFVGALETVCNRAPTINFK